MPKVYTVDEIENIFMQAVEAGLLVNLLPGYEADDNVDNWSAEYDIALAVRDLAEIFYSYQAR